MYEAGQVVVGRFFNGEGAEEHALHPAVYCECDLREWVSEGADGIGDGSGNGDWGLALWVGIVGGGFGVRLDWIGRRGVVVGRRFEIPFTWKLRSGSVRYR